MLQDRVEGMDGRLDVVFEALGDIRSLLMGNRPHMPEPQILDEPEPQGDGESLLHGPFFLGFVCGIVEFVSNAQFEGDVVQFGIGNAFEEAEEFLVRHVVTQIKTKAEEFFTLSRFI